MPIFASASVSSTARDDDLSLATHQSRVYPWLPAGALKDAKLSDALERIVLSWAKNWFVKGWFDVAIKHEGRSEDELDLGSRSGWSSGEGHEVCLMLSNFDRRLMASNMLALDLSKCRLTPPDADIIGRLTGPVILDLIVRLSAYLKVMSAPQTLPAFTKSNQFKRGFEEFKIILGKPSGIIVILLRRDVAYLARRRLSQPFRSQPELTSIQFAVANLPVKVGARVGAAHLGLADLIALAVGDVLILDRCLDEDLQVTINQRICPITKCDIQQNNGQTKLQLTTIL